MFSVTSCFIVIDLLHFTMQTSDNSGSNVKRLDEETTKKVQSFKEVSKKVSPDVVGMLMKHVMTVKN